ncbi:MAG: hypothetical protein MZW92_26305 [Comamonadaceae bacterium]|nr:hypothetical protein [Comamonadaceae bacterium]
MSSNRVQRAAVCPGSDGRRATRGLRRTPAALKRPRRAVESGKRPGGAPLSSRRGCSR